MHDVRVSELKAESVPDLLRQLAAQTTTLVRQELELAQVEVGEKARAASAGATDLGIAAALGLGAFGAITTALIAAIALALPVWAAALIVAVVYAIVAFVLVQSGKQKLAQTAPLVPPQTAQTVKEDVEWVKTRAQSGRK
jgi:uncharacterized membrane protein YqjE